MNLKGRYVAVWLVDEAAKLFLGLPQPTTKSRWDILGEVHGESGSGLWIEIDALQERKGPDAKVARDWTVSPKLCLVKWSYIITVQIWGEKVKKVKEVPRFGFRQEH